MILFPKNNKKCLNYSLVGLIFALSCTTSTERVIDTDYIVEYYPLINSAEENILNKNYAEALEMYKSAFEKGGNKNSRDLYNASVCSFIEDDNDILIKNLTILFERGMSFNTIQNTNVFKNSKSKIQEIIQSKYLEIYNSKGYSYNKEARGIINDLVAMDQIHRKKTNTCSYPDSLQKEIESTDQETIRNFLNFIDKFGFPNDALVGVGSKLTTPLYSIILHHHLVCRSFNPVLYDFIPILKQALRDGDIDPNLALGYINIAQSNNGKAFGLPLFFQLSGDTELRYHSMNEKDSISANQNRKQWGLASIDDSRTKVYYASKRLLGDFLFDCNYCVMNFSPSNGDFIKSFKEHTNVYSSLE